MTDRGIRYPAYRSNLVPAVISLANPPWQHEVWLQQEHFENLDHVVHMLFDDFCDPSAPEDWLGVSLRTEEEVELMRQLGVAWAVVEAQIPAIDSPDEVYLSAPSWPKVVAAAGRLAQVMVANDLNALARLAEAGHRWPPQ